MPRKARNKEKKQPHHIICRGIDEVDLCATDEDKDCYINLMSGASIVYNIEILSYCIMDTHVHILVHPRKGDISKFMHAINNAYAKYYNREHKRRGHLFAERFKNIVVKDLNQLLRNSTYIHNNPKDLLYKGYDGIEDYPYSSIKDYTQPGNGRGIACPNYIFHLMGGKWSHALNHYKKLLAIQSLGRESFEDEIVAEFQVPRYISDRKKILRDLGAKKVIKVLAGILCIDDIRVLDIKYQKQYSRFKALTAICLRIYCGLSLSEMTLIFRNHTSSSIGRLARIGLTEITSNKVFFSQIEKALVT